MPTPPSHSAFVYVFEGTIEIGPSGAARGVRTHHVGILADGVLVREGHLQELIAIENQTEFVIADASDELGREIESVVNRSKAKLIERRKSTTTLERLFLEATATNGEAKSKQQ